MGFVLLVFFPNRKTADWRIRSLFLGKTFTKTYRNKLEVKCVQFWIPTYFQRNNEHTKVKGHLLITGEKQTKFIIITLPTECYLSPYKNARSDCSILDSVLPCLTSPAQQLESQKSLWNLLYRKALELEIQDVQAVHHLHIVQSTPQQWCPHQVIKAAQMQVAKCNYHIIFPKGRKEQLEE